MENRNFCAACGNQLVASAAMCPKCGSMRTDADRVGNGQGSRYCTACGVQILISAGMCTSCGSPVHGGHAAPTAQSAPQYAQPVPGAKTKTTAILLAVFLGSWAWLYTYKKDAAKFWISTGLSIILLVFGIGIFTNWAFWLWAVIDVAVKTNDYYSKYPNAAK